MRPVLDIFGAGWINFIHCGEEGDPTKFPNFEQGVTVEEYQLTSTITKPNISWVRSQHFHRFQHFDIGINNQIEKIPLFAIISWSSNISID